jgi:hypothetical protein
MRRLPKQNREDLVAEASQRQTEILPAYPYNQLVSDLHLGQNS